MGWQHMNRQNTQVVSIPLKFIYFLDILNFSLEVDAVIGIGDSWVLELWLICVENIFVTALIFCLPKKAPDAVHLLSNMQIY